jgi:hypothetical protein
MAIAQQVLKTDHVDYLQKLRVNGADSFDFEGTRAEFTLRALL